MTPRGSFIAAASLVVLPSGCAPLSVHVDYDTQADFSGLRTFGWLPEPRATGVPRADNPLLHQRIREAIEAQLTAQGFVADDDPQFRVGYHLSTQQKLDVRGLLIPPSAHATAR